MERWREVSIRHGFEEVDGPTYEQADLYAVKSGDGILGELFQAFSGKSPEEVEQVKRDGRAPYALRPEFTPTLARMYAAKANTLPKPCKWFMAGPFFRAERPQRGRLREFLQWNCDVLGLDIPQEKWYAKDAESRAEVAEAKARMDAECIACCVAFLEHLGLTPAECKVAASHRGIWEVNFEVFDVPTDQRDHWFSWIDSFQKGNPTERAATAKRFGGSEEHIFIFSNLCQGLEPGVDSETRQELLELGRNDIINEADRMIADAHSHPRFAQSLDEWNLVVQYTAELGLGPWMTFDPRIVRGLAYYTGTVFEVITDGERAVAGGGRYDNLISLFGGPPTPAVGFAMGDVVLSLLLQDKGLMPTDDELLGLTGQHPDAFVLSNGSEEAEAKVRPVVAMLRRGEEREEGALSPALSHEAREREQGGLHVRHSYKATKKIDKLLNEAKKQHARFAVIIEDADSCIVKDLRTGEQWTQPVALNDLYAKLVAAT